MTRRQIKTENNARKEIGNNCMFIKVGKVNLDQLHGFLHLRNFVGHFQLQKTLHNVIIKKF